MKSDPTAEREIEAVNEKLMEAIRSGDVERIVSLYTDDGLLLPAGGGMARGRTALREAWAGVLGAGVERVDLRTEELSVMGDTAHEIGTATVHIRPPGQDSFPDPGKYVVIWQRRDGRWRLYADIFNSDTPPQ